MPLTLAAARHQHPRRIESNKVATGQDLWKRQWRVKVPTCRYCQRQHRGEKPKTGAVVPPAGEKNLLISNGLNHSLPALLHLLLLLSLQSCLTLCDPIDGSPPGSPVPGILQARTLEWVAISFSNAWKWKVKGNLLSRVWLFATPWTAAYQAPPCMGFSRQEYWSGLVATWETFKRKS